ncbi:unnamed protein product, partial [Ectocarpus sp. 8 AP-2014]
MVSPAALLLCFSWQRMFSVVGETLTLILASLPAILKIDLASSNASLAPTLALCVVCSAALGVLSTCSSPESDGRRLDLRRRDRPLSHNQRSDEASHPAPQQLLLDGSLAREEAP